MLLDPWLGFPWGFQLGVAPVGLPVAELLGLPVWTWGWGFLLGSQRDPHWDFQLGDLLGHSVGEPGLGLVVGEAMGCLLATVKLHVG